MSHLGGLLTVSIVQRRAPDGTEIYARTEEWARLTLTIPDRGTVEIRAATWTGACDAALRMLDTINDGGR